MIPERAVSYLRPLPLNEHPPLHPQSTIDGTSALALKPHAIEEPKLELVPKTPYEKPHFKALSPARQRKLRRGVMLGFVTESTLETSEGTRKVDSDSAAAQHEVLHWAALAGLENAGHGVPELECL